jgi:hypothetical protein
MCTFIFSQWLHVCMCLPRPTAKGTVDLTGAKVFLQDAAGHKALVDLVERFTPNKTVDVAGRPIRTHVCIRLLLRSLSSMYTVWSSPHLLSIPDLVEYQTNLDNFRQFWLSLAWKPAPWVHWVCAHSMFFLRMHRTFSGFTSIPCEHRHKPGPFCS